MGASIEEGDVVISETMFGVLMVEEVSYMLRGEYVHREFETDAKDVFSSRVVSR